MDANVQQTISNKYIGRLLKVQVANGRIFQGKLVSVDFRANIILHDTIAEIIPQQNCPLNYQLQNSYDVKLKYTPSRENMTTAQMEKQKYEYMGTHYYFGSVMILGQDIKRVFMRKNNQKHEEKHEGEHDQKNEEKHDEKPNQTPLTNQQSE